jgi:ferredoxin
VQQTKFIISKYFFAFFFAFKKMKIILQDNKSDLLIQNFITMAYIINDDCTACGVCVDECPVEAISEGDIYKIDPELCTDCEACVDVCPVEAIHPEE